MGPLSYYKLPRQVRAAFVAALAQRTHHTLLAFHCARVFQNHHASKACNFKRPCLPKESHCGLSALSTLLHHYDHP
ncbi:uncharacterized protein CC84DRAFT_755616 [Paraphaeosphaeria sporulosa]|uniref:Uncharacterized protein n=1 Tax=Paraphaeosphaeria sporulosa TaxID=1460663 RepID=A0A177CH07_9PLEO|nr:uncharacterized protein CC84DRAFT_755616 [Paraphaeosphaeria sporulosa]OAG06232.1 hypothetical protein CC84DRAFT_755616 [Paraphaeosphaeria sporulosa]